MAQMSEFYSNFKYLRYTKAESMARPFDESMALRGMMLEFLHIPTGKVLHFKAFITTFSETYSPSWTAEQVFGRMDPIYMFKNTKRSISLAFKVPAANRGEAYENLGKTQLLTQFLYPTYKDPAQAQTIVQSPLIRLKIMNFVRDTNGMIANNDQAALEMFNNYDMGGQGLLGTIGNITIDHGLDTDSGVIEKGTSEEGLQAILPKLLQINLDFQPIHEHPLGWDEDDRFGQFKEEKGELFPYGVTLKDTSPAAAAKEQADDQLGGGPGDGNSTLPTSDAVPLNPYTAASLAGDPPYDPTSGRSGVLSNMVVPTYSTVDGGDLVALGPDGTPWDEYIERQEYIIAQQAALDASIALELAWREEETHAQAKADQGARRRRSARKAEAKAQKEADREARLKKIAEEAKTTTGGGGGASGGYGAGWDAGD